MSNLISIKDLPGVFGIKVPIDASEFIKCTLTVTGSDAKKYSIQYQREAIRANQITIPFDLKIIGTVTKSEISFDASDVVEKVGKLFKNYEASISFWNGELSFRSALDVAEIYFENPFGENPYPNNSIDLLPMGNIDSAMHDLENWQSAQQKITEKLLIVQDVSND